MTYKLGCKDSCFISKKKREKCLPWPFPIFMRKREDRKFTYLINKGFTTYLKVIPTYLWFSKRQDQCPGEVIHFTCQSFISNVILLVSKLKVSFNWRRWEVNLNRCKTTQTSSLTPYTLKRWRVEQTVDGNLKETKEIQKTTIPLFFRYRLFYIGTLS